MGRERRVPNVVSISTPRGHPKRLANLASVDQEPAPAGSIAVRLMERCHPVSDAGDVASRCTGVRKCRRTSLEAQRASMIHFAGGEPVKRSVHLATHDRWTKRSEGVEARVFPKQLARNGEMRKTAVAMFTNCVSEAITSPRHGPDRRGVELAARIREVADRLAQPALQDFPRAGKLGGNFVHFFVR